ncbi:MAG: type II secretion system F family protein [Alphaproteobacteria bacterium]
MNGADPALLAAAAAVLAAVAVLAGGLAFAGGDRARLRRRLAAVAARRTAPVGAAATATVRREGAGEGTLERLAVRLLPRPALLRQRLTRAGLAGGAGRYLLFVLLAAAVAFLALAGLLRLPPLVCGLAAVAAGLLLPHLAVGWLVLRRRAAFTAAFPEAIELIVRGLKSGLPVSESIRAVGNEFAAPVGEEFRRIADVQAVGRTLEEALWEAAPRIDTAEFRFFVVALSVQRETGGNLGETLANLADVLRRRRQMKQKIRAMASEPKASAWILGSLPFVMAGLIWAVNAGYVATLLDDPRGAKLIAAGLVSQAIGVAIMARMVRFEI